MGRRSTTSKEVQIEARTICEWLDAGAEITRWTPGRVWISAGGQDYDSSGSADLTPDEAREFAAELVRLADEIEAAPDLYVRRPR